MKRRIAILGSTGSVGRQTLEVIAAQPDYFSVEVLTAYRNADLLIKQAKTFRPNAVVIGDESLYNKVAEVLQDDGIKVYAGEESLSQITGMESIDRVMMAILGFNALGPALAALKNKKPLALASKEILAAAGELIRDASRENKTPVIPVDSEHSAVFQCLTGEEYNPVEKIVLTASGGPFLNRNESELAAITPEEALQHPTWNMGPKTTIDSATLMNKGLEVMEARWLFDLEPDRIELLLHPQSLVHALVYFTDGSVKALLGTADMRIPIQFALSYPQRLNNSYRRLDLAAAGKLTFHRPDIKKFRNLALAFEAMKKGGNMPCILNAANEIAVEAFLRKQIGYLDIPKITERCMNAIPFMVKPGLEDYLETDRQTRIKAKEFVRQL